MKLPNASTVFASLVSFQAGTAAAHTGHGHESLTFLQGLRHAVGEPDHLLMLAFGFGFTTLAAPRVLRLLRRALRLLRVQAARRRQRTPRDVSL